MAIPAIDWSSMFVPTMSLAELVLRGSAMYLGILVLMRILNRQKGAMSTADLLVLIVVADAAQNAMAAEYHSITEGFVLVGTIFAWDYVLDALSFRFSVVRRLLNSPALELVKNGQLQRQNMRKQMITKADLLEQLREQGVDDVADVKLCCLESDGHVSVIKIAEADARPASPTSAVR